MEFGLSSEEIAKVVLPKVGGYSIFVDSEPLIMLASLLQASTTSFG